MQIDSVAACLLVALGASIANVADEAFSLTPRLSDWITRLLDLS